MADLDTQYKRASAVAISLYSMGGSRVFPSIIGGAQARRQAKGYGYYGILASSGVEAAAPVIINIGAHGILAGKGNHIGRGL